jgi:predicted transcriptional regulator
VISDQIACTSKLTGVDITKYLLSKIINDQAGIKRMTQVLDHDERLVSELLGFFRDAGWIKHNVNHTYEITMKGKKIIE